MAHPDKARLDLEIPTLPRKKEYVTSGRNIIQLGQATMSTQPSTQLTVAADLASLAGSLRKQFADSQSTQPGKWGRKSPNSEQLNELQDQVVSLLDLLDEAPANASPPTPSTIGETLDRSLAQWQAQIGLTYSQGAAQELAELLQKVALLNDSLLQREARLESQRAALEQATADMLQQQARTHMQRRVIAQTMRAQKAELMLEYELLRQNLAEQAELERTQRVDAQSPAEALDTQDYSQLELELQEVRTELVRTQQDLQETALLLQELEQSQAIGPAECNESNEKEYRNSSAKSDALIAELESRLANAGQELSDLKNQNFDLASQVAKHQVLSSGHSPQVNFDSSALTWEERKQLIMRQLEDELAEDGRNDSTDATGRLEIEKVLQTTQVEIDRRDTEIAELHSIIQQQSDTRQGVAIGAAAFAQAFDADEIIQQERQKLKEIQLQWEDKLRQAEIDVSLERARLARERTQLELELDTTQRERKAAGPPPTESKRRKWLDHLGLREENRNDK